jgi:hypothetical protein
MNTRATAREWLTITLRDDDITHESILRAIVAYLNATGDGTRLYHHHSGGLDYHSVLPSSWVCSRCQTVNRVSPPVTPATCICEMCGHKTSRVHLEST